MPPRSMWKEERMMNMPGVIYHSMKKKKDELEKSNMADHFELGIFGKGAASDGIYPYIEDLALELGAALCINVYLSRFQILLSLS
ncbi:hypothetical protein GDO78_020491 [Eleutherodactylus coqui]|uniref:Uncharacterized protein n=1 Tax=Eleutherodactylus coqui TaxID=57060 RepID=A0A8J6JTC9_ELECQ|nr:hypothetical protein GDO78_020491 [Eleutherodactylus coqui]